MRPSTLPRLGAALIACAGLAALAMAEDTAPSPAPAPDQPSGVYRFFDVDPDLHAWGASAVATLGLRLFDGVDSGLRLQAGGMWSTKKYWRLADGSLYRADLNPGVPAEAAGYQTVTVPWSLGVAQGLHFDPARDRNDLELSLLWRGIWNENLLSATPGSLLEASGDAARERSVLTWLVLAARYDHVTKDPVSRAKSGLRLDASLECGPPGWSLPAGSTWLQGNLTVTGFVPLHRDVGADGFNRLSLYLGGRASVDGIVGLGTGPAAGIPFVVSRSFGGLEREAGLGGAVRGAGAGWGDGVFKAVGNLELRCNLPAFIDPSLLFGALVFVDAGVWAGPPGLPAGAQFGSGFLASAGLGVFLDFFGIGTGVIRTSFQLAQPSAGGESWVPIEISFGQHF